jgi:very-short-patch-repair endonuclease
VVEKAGVALSGADVDRLVAELAGGQHGIVARSQLLERGVNPRALAHRLESGRLFHIHRGVYAVGHRAFTDLGRELAAVFACGPEALLGLFSAGGRWEIRAPWRGAIHVVSARTRMHHGVVGHRTRRLPPEDAAVCCGIPITSPARTLVDLAGVLSPRELERAIHRTELLGLATLDELEVRFSSDRPGIGKLRDILAVGTPAPTRSELEQQFLAFVDDHALPKPRVNEHVEGFEVDFHWPDARLVVELDGFAFHGTREAFERDRARDAALQAAGWRSVRVTRRRLMHDEETLAHQLHALVE